MNSRFCGLVTGVFVLISLLSCLTLRSAVAAGPESFDFALGVGTNINTSCFTKQVLFVPAAQWRVDRVPSFRLRLESNLELICYDGKMTVIAGLAPMVRLFVFSGEGTGPFVEGGVGAHYLSRSTMGPLHLGGPLTFSPTVGVGYAFSGAGRSSALSLRYRHVSNASLYPSNDGLDSLYLMGTVSF